MLKQKITPSSVGTVKKKRYKNGCNETETSTSQRLYHTMSSGTTPAFPCHHCRRSFHSVDARRMHVTRDHVDVHLNRRHRLRWCTTCNIWVERDGTHSLSRLHTTSTASSAVGSQQHEEEEHSYEEQEDDEDDGDQLQASQREPSRRRNVNSGLFYYEEKVRRDTLSLIHISEPTRR